MASCYSVGSYLSGWWEEDDTYAVRTGSVVVVASSRATRRISSEQAEQLLRERWGSEEKIIAMTVVRWYAITRRDWSDLPAEQDRAGFSASGTGQGWIDVAIPKFASGA